MRKEKKGKGKEKGKKKKKKRARFNYWCFKIIDLAFLGKYFKPSVLSPPPFCLDQVRLVDIAHVGGHPIIDTKTLLVRPIK